MSERIRPAGDYIVVDPRETPEKSGGGVVLPETARYVPQQGTVLAVGPGSLLYDANGACIVVDGKPLRRPMDCKEGDEVLVSGHAGVQAPVNGKMVLMVKIEEVLGYVEPESVAAPFNYQIAGAVK